MRIRKGSMVGIAVIICLLPCVPPAGGNTRGGDYFIIGANTAQKVRWEVSSSHGPNHTGFMAVDSDIDSSWRSARSESPQWLSVDFGAKRLLTKIVIVPGYRDNYRMLRNCTVQFIYNGEWFDFARVEFTGQSRRGIIARLAGRAGAGDRAEVDLGGVDASKFRILVPVDGMVDGQAAIAEVECFVGANSLRYFDGRLKGLCMPVRNALLPPNDAGYPNAQRAYRGGIHAGLDIYSAFAEGSYEAKPVDFTTAVYAADGGTVIRADWKYEALTPVQWKQQSEYTKSNPRTFVLRSFGGRQVWIDHGNGVVTTYNHLSEIDRRIVAGGKVSKGQRIGRIGNSGLLGEAEGEKYGAHLHFEIWVDGFYLGYGMALADVKKYFGWIFATAVQPGE
ncbi:MAG TPA: peptidoglycan DD-metalloendopeptidase family protein [Spirochaetota bacterium]|nr:peptidoglycan DD-metalloendopeptidase family protein [Spirochaetota bacterium]